MRVILFQPEIPQNTGNIIRTCNVTQTGLTLVRPYSFSLSSRFVKRAGLDYFHEVDIEEIEDLEIFLEKTTCPFYFFSSKAHVSYTQVSYPQDALLIFGNETSGLPAKFSQKWPEKFVTIPMKKKGRCLNLSNCVAIAIYEAFRQQDFSDAKITIEKKIIAD